MLSSRPDAGHNDEGMQRETLDLLLIRLWLNSIFELIYSEAFSRCERSRYITAEGVDGVTHS